MRSSSIRTSSPAHISRRNPMPRNGALRRAGRASVFLGLLWTASWPQAALAQDLVITNARILDGTGRVIDRGSVVITAGRIASVSAGTTAAPRGARVVDVQGRTVLPGFTDAHRHIIRGDGAQWLKEQAAARMQE